MSVPDPGNGNDRLDSWKEIAAHFGSTERTVQRWEETEGLPVHRRIHRTRHSVHAYRAELDQWWASRLTKEGPKPEVERLDSPTVEPVRPPATRPRRYWILGVLTTVLSALVFAVLALPRKAAVAPLEVVRSGRLLANLTREAGQTRRIPLGGRPIASILTPDERELYVALDGGVIAVFDTVNLRITHRLQAGGFGAFEK